MVDTHAPLAPAWVRVAATLTRWLPAGRYRLMNWLCRRPGVPFWARCPAELGRFTFLCDLRDSICREVCFTGRYEPQETALVKALLQPGMTFLDVGANWGYFSLLGAFLAGPSGRVISLEPEPRLFACLEKNAARNGFAQIRCLSLAAADREGSLQFAGFSDDQSNWGISRLVARDAAPASTFAVPTQSLDRLLDELGVASVDLLKMDIEGAEGFALAGLERTLREQRVSRLLLELHPAELKSHGQTVADVVAPLRALGYTGWGIAHNAQDTRKAAYARQLDVQELLRPFSEEELGAWPHTLWVRPGLSTLP